MKKLLILTLTLVSTSALAHPGHLPAETVHGFLHTEHIIALVAVAIVAGIVALRQGK